MAKCAICEKGAHFGLYRSEPFSQKIKQNVESKRKICKG